MYVYVYACEMFSLSLSFPLSPSLSLPLSLSFPPSLSHTQVLWSAAVHIPTVDYPVLPMATLGGHWLVTRVGQMVHVMSR